MKMSTTNKDTMGEKKHEDERMGKLKKKGGLKVGRERGGGGGGYINWNCEENIRE